MDRAAEGGQVGRDDRRQEIEVTGSEDFGAFGTALGVPSVFWHFGGADPALFQHIDPGTLLTDGLPDTIPANHSPYFAPVPEPTIRTGVTALLAAAAHWLAGRSLTEGSLVDVGSTATENAPVIDRILDAGGIIHARTATPEFSIATFTHSRLWGVTRNPWNPEFTPGGSSGGAGASLAAGTALLTSASDIGGATRIPAAFTGTVGYKAPYGRIPGVAPPAAPRSARPHWKGRQGRPAAAARSDPRSVRRIGDSWPRCQWGIRVRRLGWQAAGGGRARWPRRGRLRVLP